jgi:hypothetical protein
MARPAFAVIALRRAVASLLSLTAASDFSVAGNALAAWMKKA